MADGERSKASAGEPSAMRLWRGKLVERINAAFANSMDETSVAQGGITIVRHALWVSSGIHRSGYSGSRPRQRRGTPP
ncbi:hypothetical protein ABDD95_19165 [Mucilaginibacter sp. PAMB04274]|uniref:hypothetical protein n=1 Tax=Mucilaginibacter sp. PAMB04274 TaxID=3138568 RepID=UPI0031F6254C